MLNQMQNAKWLCSLVNSVRRLSESGSLFWEKPETWFTQFPNPNSKLQSHLAFCLRHSVFCKYPCRYRCHFHPVNNHPAACFILTSIFFITNCKFYCMQKFPRPLVITLDSTLLFLLQHLRKILNRRAIFVVYVKSISLAFIPLTSIILVYINFHQLFIKPNIYSK